MVPGYLPVFQSLSRDSGRLNQSIAGQVYHIIIVVSIPQSGFGAFEQSPEAKARSAAFPFQSLSRDSGRLNVGVRIARVRALESFNPSVGIRGV